MDLFTNPANTFVAGFIGSPPMNQIEATVGGSTAAPIAEIAGQRVLLPALPELAERIGAQVTVGIRPEHAQVHQLDDNPISVELDLVETLGSEALLHTTLAGKPFIIKTETEGYFDSLQQVSAFSVNPAQIKVFDIDTGRVFGQSGA